MTPEATRESNAVYEDPWPKARSLPLDHLPGGSRIAQTYPVRRTAASHRTRTTMKIAKREAGLAPWLCHPMRAPGCAWVWRLDSTNSKPGRTDAVLLPGMHIGMADSERESRVRVVFYSSKANAFRETASSPNFSPSANHPHGRRNLAEDSPDISGRQARKEGLPGGAPSESETHALAASNPRLSLSTQHGPTNTPISHRRQLTMKISKREGELWAMRIAPMRDHHAQPQLPPPTLAFRPACPYEHNTLA